MSPASFTTLEKTEHLLQQVNLSVLKQLNPEQVKVEIRLAEAPEEQKGTESELDEMWSYVTKKANPRWLWHAIDHDTGQVLASVLGEHKDEVFLQFDCALSNRFVLRTFTLMAGERMNAI